MVLERNFQASLIRELDFRFPGCVVQKLDTGYQQGIPDLLILFGKRWAILEVKRKRPTKESDWEPNQQWFIEKLDRMSYSACIYPENAEEILNDLQQALSPRRAARVSQR
jgi:hypothetical protein